MGKMKEITKMEQSVDYTERYNSIFDKLCNEKVKELKLKNWLELNYGFIWAFEKMAARFAEYDCDKGMAGSFEKLKSEFDRLYDLKTKLNVDFEDMDLNESDTEILLDWIDLNRMILD